MKLDPKTFGLWLFSCIFGSDTFSVSEAKYIKCFTHLRCHGLMHCFVLNLCCSSFVVRRRCQVHPWFKVASEIEGYPKSAMDLSTKKNCGKQVFLFHSEVSMRLCVEDSNNVRGFVCIDPSNYVWLSSISWARSNQWFQLCCSPNDNVLLTIRGALRQKIYFSSLRVPFTLNRILWACTVQVHNAQPHGTCTLHNNKSEKKKLNQLNFWQGQWIVF